MNNQLPYLKILDNVEGLSDQINIGIRNMAETVRKHILKNDISMFTKMTQDMIIASRYSYDGYETLIKEVCYDACFDLEKNLDRRTIADTFYKRVIDICRSFMN